MALVDGGGILDEIAGSLPEVRLEGPVEVNDTYTCPKCGGSGWEKVDIDPCARCEGAGVLVGEEAARARRADEYAAKKAVRKPRAKVRWGGHFRILDNANPKLSDRLFDLRPMWTRTLHVALKYAGEQIEQAALIHPEIRDALRRNCMVSVEVYRVG